MRLSLTTRSRARYVSASFLCAAGGLGGGGYLAREGQDPGNRINNCIALY